MWRRKSLRKKSASPTAECKDRIQALLREIAIIRDGGCVFRNYPESGDCGGYRKDGELILQFDHLNTRARNISFGDARLGVCVCLRHHFYYKKQFPFEYERIAIEVIGEKRATLLHRVREDRKSYPFGIYEWGNIELALQQELQKLKEK